MRTVLKMVAAGVGMTASVSAMSMPVFQNWDADVRAGFTAFGPVPGVTGSDNTNLFSVMNVPQTLSWGVPFAPNTQQSSLNVGTITPLELVTNGGLEQSGFITHNNFPITGTFLSTATLTSEILLTSGALVLPDAISLNINFRETPNRGGAGGVCLGQAGLPNNTSGAPGVNSEGCADIFVVDVTGAGFNAAGQIVRNLGVLPGDPDFTYTAIIEIAGAMPLTAAECAAAGSASSTCVGFLTAENASSVAFTSLGIFAREISVPAPAPILGLGLGLLMMARARRRKS